MDITFINVGYGESILITCADPERENGQFVMLIDGGSAMDSEYVGQSGRIRSYDFLKKTGITHIDLLVFSHIHEDHTSGLIPVINEIPVCQYWTSVILDPNNYGKIIDPDKYLTDTNRKALFSINAYSQLMKELPSDKITWLDGIIPSYFKTNEFTIDVLGPDKDYKEQVEKSLNSVFTAMNAEALNKAVTDTTETMNNASLILRLHYKGYRVLLCGDTNAGGFSHIKKENSDLLHADVFKIGHHGQADSVDEELIRLVDPSVIVCCASNDYRSNSSNPRTFETIQKALGEKKVCYLFQDGLYASEWNENTSPRNGVTIHLGEKAITWETVLL